MSRGSRPSPGAAAALGALKGDRVAVVTSGTRPLALARLAAVGIEPPAVMVFADDVTRGKPDPEGYLTAARRLGADPAEALVVEDAPPGIEAAKAAGAATVAVTSTHAARGARGGRRGDRVAGGAAGAAGGAVRCGGGPQTAALRGVWGRNLSPCARFSAHT